MARHTQRWKVRLEQEFGHRDITADVAHVVAQSGVRDGLALVALPGSTGAVTTIEYEPGALADFRRALDVVAPTGQSYAHDARWGDGNGFAHVRSALLKPSLTVPIVDGRLELGTWQQIVVLNLDNRPREREVVVVVVG